MKKIDQGPKRVYVAECLEEKSCSSGVDITEVASFKLPAGKYAVTVSFNLYLGNGWLYGGFRADSSGINQRIYPFGDHQGFYGQTNVWQPIMVSFIYPVESEKTVTFELFSGTSYPSRCQNFIMTAERISEK